MWAVEASEIIVNQRRAAWAISIWSAVGGLNMGEAVVMGTATGGIQWKCWRQPPRSLFQAWEHSHPSMGSCVININKGSTLTKLRGRPSIVVIFCHESGHTEKTLSNYISFLKTFVNQGRPPSPPLPSVALLLSHQPSLFVCLSKESQDLHVRRLQQESHGGNCR